MSDSSSDLAKAATTFRSASDTLSDIEPAFTSASKSLATITDMSATPAAALARDTSLASAASTQIPLNDVAAISSAANIQVSAPEIVDGSTASADPPTINFMNKSGSAVKPTSSSWDPSKQVLDIVIDAASKPGSFRNNIKAAVRG